MASIGHFAQSYITNLYDKQKNKTKKSQPIGCPPPPPPPVVTPLLEVVSVGVFARRQLNNCMYE